MLRNEAMRNQKHPHSDFARLYHKLTCLQPVNPRRLLPVFSRANLPRDLPGILSVTLFQLFPIKQQVNAQRNEQDIEHDKGGFAEKR